MIANCWAIGTPNLSSSGNFTVDATTDIILDADGGDIQFKDGGTEFGRVFQSGNNMYIKSTVSDGDIIFQGNDGGVSTTVLSLDMSTEGTAVFNGNVGLGQTPTAFSNWRVLELKAGSAGAMINYENSSSARVAALAYDEGSTLLRMQTMIDADITLEPNNAVALTLDGSQNAQFAGVVTANAGVVVDNFTLDGTTLALSSGDFTVDVAGDIHLDSSSGEIRFYDGGTYFGKIRETSGNLEILSGQTDKDMKFIGNDGGSEVTMLSLDAENAGDATFNNFVTANRFYVPDSGLFIAGGGGDLKLSSDGTNGLIETVNGNLTLDVAGDIILDADGGDITIKDGGTTYGSIGVANGDLHIGSNGDQSGLRFQATSIMPRKNGADANGTVDLGLASNQFKDAYLSGGVVFGPASASNVSSQTLDSYEEGTWTPVLTGVASQTLGNSVGYYTKIGRQVFFQWYSSGSTIGTANGPAMIAGLPFTASSAGASYGLFQYLHGTGVLNSTGGYVNINNTNMLFISENTTSASNFSAGSGKYIMIQGSYSAA